MTNNQQSTSSSMSSAAYARLVEQITERVWRLLQAELRAERERTAARQRR